MTRNAVDLEVNRGLMREMIEKKIGKANQPVEDNLQRVGPENLLEGIELRTPVIWGMEVIYEKSMSVITRRLGVENRP